jgi:hypothetical protein
MATRLGKHPIRTTEKGTEKWCSGCKKFCPITEFHVGRTGARAGERRGRCRSCYNTPLVKHGQATGWIPIDRVWWIFDEITQRLGQQRAADTIGFGVAALRSILYRRTYNVQKRFVVAALAVLRELRSNVVWDPPRLGRPLRYVARCKGCGTELSNYTDDCRVCWERRRGRARRATSPGFV